MRPAQRIRLLAILLAAISTRLLASSAPLRINESEMNAVISEREIVLIVQRLRVVFEYVAEVSVRGITRHGSLRSSAC
jgi:hypothetical protein